MELRQLEHFVAAAETGHFTQAAGRCHISQSALSMSIRSLERELGSPLFARTTRRVELTAAGRTLLDEARRTLSSAASARDAVLAMRGLLRGSLAVGGIPTPESLDQASLLARFRERYPAVDICYVRNTSMALIPEVEASQLDVAFVSLPDRLPDQVRAIPLSTQPMMLVCRPDHPLADRASVALEELADQEFVGAPKGSVSHEAVDRVFARAGRERRVPFEVNEILAIMDFVAHGLGVSLVQERLAISRPDLRAIPLTGIDLTWTLAAIVSRHRASPAARAFLALLPQAEPGSLASLSVPCGRLGT